MLGRVLFSVNLKQLSTIKIPGEFLLQAITQNFRNLNFLTKKSVSSLALRKRINGFHPFLHLSKLKKWVNIFFLNETLNPLQPTAPFFTTFLYPLFLGGRERCIGNKWVNVYRTNFANFQESSQ